MTKEIKEPFRTVLEQRKKYEPSIDFKVKDGADHLWLKRHGYSMNMGGDCSYYEYDKEGNLKSGLNASSYGDWGEYHCTFDKNDECYGILMQMFEEDIIELWRIRVYIDHQVYDYDSETDVWMTYTDEEKWHPCVCPLS